MYRKQVDNVPLFWYIISRKEVLDVKKWLFRIAAALTLVWASYWFWILVLVEVS